MQRIGSLLWRRQHNEINGNMGAFQANLSAKRAAKKAFPKRNALKIRYGVSDGT
jgi:hypothetical protein